MVLLIPTLVLNIQLYIQGYNTGARNIDSSHHFNFLAIIRDRDDSILRGMPLRKPLRKLLRKPLRKL